ncbi:MAG: NAD-dependent DNA ligase LigA, partial [Suipraeoptans intestinalis]|nr:NAD-dependent DNA ligase LigA [Suipraeoptans intestinalis]
MEELIEILNKASYAYYQQAEEQMSNLEYDALYEELVALEKETGITRADSPTVNVGYEVVSQLPKERHERPMLSLDKTKSAEELAEFLGVQKGVLSWKMDGLTIVLTYREGRLYKAVTRGNGETGEIVTPNAKTFRNLPLKIKYPNELILRGEAVIGYRDFEEINRKLPEVEAKYKNPRNLCSGSVRQLNSQITKSRQVSFYGFSVVKAEGVDFENSRKRQLDWLEEQGFEVVEHCLVTQDTLRQTVEEFSSRIGENDFPSDGLVLNYDDIAYGESLGQTSKFPRDSMAFKWEDEKRETTLLSIEWSPSRTGLINPVAIFEPVELEGTTVSRASVHNISILEELELGIGDRLLVYKANMIIPQIAENLTKSGNLEIPSTCPVCQGKTSIRQTGSARALYCDNPDCQAKQIKA